MIPQLSVGENVFQYQNIISFIHSYPEGTFHASVRQMDCALFTFICKQYCYVNLTWFKISWEKLQIKLKFINIWTADYNYLEYFYSYLYITPSFCAFSNIKPSIQIFIIW